MIRYTFLHTMLALTFVQNTLYFNELLQQTSFAVLSV